MDQTVALNNNQTVALGATQMGNLAGAPAPMPNVASPGINLRVVAGNRLAHTGTHSRTHVMTQIQIGAASSGAGMVGGQRMPVNVSLVIDRSGSMEGEPLEYVKRACMHVVDMLTPEDVLSIITFESNVEVIMPARRVTDPNLIKQHISRIVAGNTTDLFGGLSAGGSQAASVPLAGYVTRVLLLTDGEPTAGLRDFQSIVGQVADLKNRGVTVTALGFGPEYNEELMAGIARRSGGNYYYIRTPEEIPQVFATEMQQIMGVALKNPRLALHLPQGNICRQCYGTPPTFGPRIAEIALPDLERGAILTKLWEMELEPRTLGTFRVAKAVLTYEENGQMQTVSGDAVVQFIDDAAQVPSGADPQVAQELSVIQATRNLEQTMMGMRTQALSMADVTMALNKTQAMFTSQGRTEAAQEVAQAAQAFQQGDTSAVEKTLMGTLFDLDQGKR
jgi:Ca-activated chloride channel homolog